jgi:hypothetical protein
VFQIGFRGFIDLIGTKLVFAPFLTPQLHWKKKTLLTSELKKKKKLFFYYVDNEGTCK